MPELAPVITTVLPVRSMPIGKGSTFGWMKLTMMEIGRRLEVGEERIRVDENSNNTGLREEKKSRLT